MGSAMFFGCEKDKLNDELAVFEGRYTWEYSRYKENWWSSTYKTRLASTYDYTAEVEFDNEGSLIFYINGKEIHCTRYKIEKQEILSDSSISLELDPSKENSKKLDLNDVVRFNLKNDTLMVNDFPGASYDDNVPGSHYFIRN
jgi:hypothetical protein